MKQLNEKCIRGKKWGNKSGKGRNKIGTKGQKMKKCRRKEGRKASHVKLSQCLIKLLAMKAYE
jgi:hypothetical protein